MPFLYFINNTQIYSLPADFFLGLVIVFITILLYNPVKTFNILWKEIIMSRIESFRNHLTEKRAVKVIAGIDNFDIEIELLVI